MQEALDNSNDHMHGLTVSVLSPEKNISWKKAKGFDSAKEEKEVEIDQPYRIASITKTFVAASILRLHEMDSISIHDPISKYISLEHQKILKSDEYDVDKITILHCLNHSSGLYDYAMGDSPFVKVVIESPEKRWTRTDQISFAVEHGDKLGYPGEKYAYSDTGYVLLGETIEHFYEGDLAFGLRDLIGFEKLDMNHTWLESLEEAPEGMKPMVKIYLGSLEANEFDPSCDLYGGGGLVSTSEDLSKFMHALFNGGIFEDPSSLELMIQKQELDPDYDTFEDRRYKDYRKMNLFLPR